MPTLAATPRSAHARALAAFAVIGVVSCSGVFFGGAPAVAHDATPTAAKPNGWAYPFSCCSGYDCREVPQTSISERPEGYVIGSTGEVLGYRDARLKDSPDGEYHWCSVAGADDSRTICLFVPPKSY
ncbi:hypothetical protein RB623_24625 [Mesorhizobium sp. LHD-90]|uniref:hypothetical protein n=1 Tax=Mesorhizobium sp. LHD-90 TaxID=3071414 RepID=UPI0027E06545|nr:hypothetical protein [Mesorhizobium sp. LHD-90]MDQ6437249.1 hypothetical protein [Mesorhizobium sp. LHD-90]